MAEKITISAPFSQESRSLGRIGRVGENLSRQIVFDCTSALTDRPNATIVCVIQRTGDKEPYAAQMTRVGDTGSYKLVLTSTEVAKSGSVRFELRMVDGEEILKAAIYTGTVEASMSGIGNTPGEPIPDALNRLETAISEVGKYADLKEKVDALQTSGASTAEVAGANAVSIHGADGVYDLSKGTIQARLNELETGEGLKVEKSTLKSLRIIGEKKFTMGSLTLEPHSIYCSGGSEQISMGAYQQDYFIVVRPEKIAQSSDGVLIFFSIIYDGGDFVVGNLVFVNPTDKTLKTDQIENGRIYAIAPSETSVVTNVSGNVISGGTGDVTKLYGHNMRDGSRFGKLNRMTDAEYLAEHPYVRYASLYEICDYRPIAVFYANVDPTAADYFDFAVTDFPDETSFTAYVQEAKRRSVVNLPATAQYGDNLLTLATCSEEGVGGRLVVVCMPAE